MGARDSLRITVEVKRDVWDYSSDSVLKNEIDCLFERFWHFGGHVNEIQNDMDYISLLIYNFEIIIYNDKGNIICYENVCPHRGARLLNHEYKVCNHSNSKIKCRYHGWRFHDNRLFSTSSNIKNAGIFVHENINDRKNSLFMYKVSLCRGFIFFSLRPIMSLREQLGDFFEQLGMMSDSLDKLIDVNIDTRFNANWKISVENALEGYHIQYVHPNSLGKLNLNPLSTTFSNCNSKWQAVVQDKKMHYKLKKVRALFDCTNYSEDGYFSIYLFPFCMISSTYGYSYSWQNFFPHKTGHTNFISRTYASKSNVNVDAFLRSVVDMNRQIFDEDAGVADSIQIAANSNRYNFVYDESLEDRIVEFHNLYDKYMIE